LEMNDSTGFSNERLLALGGSVSEYAAKARDAQQITDFVRDALQKLGVQTAITNTEFEKDLKLQQERTKIAGKSEREQAIAAVEAKYATGEQRDELIKLINAEYDAMDAAEKLKKEETKRADEVKKKAQDLQKELEKQSKDYLDQLMAAQKFAEESITGGMSAKDKLRDEYEQQLALFRQYQADMETLGYDSADVQRGIRAKLYQDLNDLNEKEIRDAQSKNDKLKGYWENYRDSVAESAMSTDELWTDTLQNFSRAVSQATTDAISEWEGWGNLAATIIESVSRSMIQALIEMGTQRLALWAIEKMIGTASSAGYIAQVTGQANAGVQMAGINAYASAAAIP
ncbi:MAG: hypothetical protein LRY59_05230, partial [Bacteroides graminisolvens]|nr:hypothetical protein [Bacteroides graminisolvens]